MEDIIRSCQTLAELDSLCDSMDLYSSATVVALVHRGELISNELEMEEENKMEHGSQTSPDQSCTPEEYHQPSLPLRPSNQEGRGNVDPESYYTLRQISDVTVKQFKTTGTDYEMRFNDLNITSIDEILSVLHGVFENLLQRLTAGMTSRDGVRLVMQSPTLRYPIAVKFMQPDQLTAKRFFAQMERSVQSNEHFSLNENVHLNLIHTELPEGGMNRRQKYINFEKYLTRKNCFIQIQNKDSLYLSRSLVVAMAKINKNPYLASIINPRSSRQEQIARKLHADARVPLGRCGIEEVKQFQTYLTDYQINIISKDHMNSIIYSGPKREKKIYLLYYQNHYAVITSLPAFFCRKKFCYKCNKPYDHPQEHACDFRCGLCFRTDCIKSEWVHCNECNRFFQSQQCYQNHKTSMGEERTVFNRCVKCAECNKLVDRKDKNPDKHHCGLQQCTICKKYVVLEHHKCFIQPVTKKKRKRNDEEDDEDGVDGDSFIDGEASPKRMRNDDEDEEKRYVFFDFECRQETGEHVPSLVICKDNEGVETMFSGSDTKD